MIGLAAAALAGCASVESVAPRITPAMTRSAESRGGSAESLETGRRLLAARCTSCHALEPIADYSVAEWQANVRRMTRRAKLSEDEVREITTYLVAARESLVEH
jgi:cytochrome c5